ncbi:MAG: protein translocase SEC61 complex subunit gamma [Asgard group archaeon]|nr:protein translocase SEC61 complex subunit gamma [Asgard group archaeon]
MNIEEFFIRSRRLLKHSKRPDRQEIWLTVRITAIGILAMGLVGYIIHLLFTVIIPGPPT